MKVGVLVCCVLVGCSPDVQNLGNTASAPPDSGPVPGSARWAIAVGGDYDDVAVATAIDSTGDVVAVGTSAGPKDDQGLIPCSSFVTKRLASDGSEVWTDQLVPQTPYESFVDVTAVAIDTHGSVIVTGSYIGTVDFGGQTLSLSEPTPGSHTDMFLAKYTSDGDLQWAHSLGATVGAQGNAVAVDTTGRIFVTGGFTGPLTLGSDHYTNDSNWDGFLAAFDPSGALVWGHAFDGSGGVTPAGVVVTENGDAAVAGSFSSPASFGGPTLDPGPYARGFVTRFSNDGLFLWSAIVGAGAPSQSWAGQIAAGAAGVVVQTTEQDSGTVPSNAGLYVFDDAGHQTWSATFRQDGSSSPQQRALALGPSGLMMSVAWADGPYDAAHPDTVAGNMEVVAYDASGQTATTVVGRRLLGALGSTGMHGSAVSSTGAVSAVGEFVGQLDLGYGALAPHASANDDPEIGPTPDTDALIVLIDPPAAP